MPSGNYKFAKSPYVVISWSRIITQGGPQRCDKVEPIGRHKAWFRLRVGFLIVLVNACWLLASFFPFSDIELLGAVIFQPGFLRRFLSKRNMNFLSPFDRQLVWVRTLAFPAGREEAENVTMPGAGRTWNQVPQENEEAGHLAHAGAWETVLKVGWAVGGDRQQSMSLRSHSPHNLITDHLRIWESRPVAHTVWESSFFCLVAPESPGSRKHLTLDFVECWKEHRSWWTSPLLLPLQESPWIPYWNLQNVHIFSL